MIVTYDLIITIAMVVAAIGLVVYLVGKAQNDGPQDYRQIGAQILELTAELARLAYRILALERLIAEHENGIALLVGQVQGLGLQPAYNPQGLTQRDASGRLAIVRLYELLATYFNLEELIDLSFRVGVVTEDDIEGDTRAARAREMVLYFDRRGRLADLARAAKMARPHVQWPDIVQQ